MRLRLLVTIAVAAMVTAACTESSGEETTSTTAPPATTTTTTTPPPALDSDDALPVAHAYFEAYNTGDTEGVLALFADDATFSDNFGAQSRTAWEQILAWNAGQGTVLDAVECAATNESGDSIIVSCVFENSDALVQAVEGPAVPVTLTLTITPDGIVEWEFSFGQPDFNAVWNPFRDWMSNNHPEDLNKVGYGNWSSVEEATQNGLLTAQYADVWKTYLETNDCTYSDGC